jgi:hypothetical protein
MLPISSPIRPSSQSYTGKHVTSTTLHSIAQSWREGRDVIQCAGEIKKNGVISWINNALNTDLVSYEEQCNSQQAGARVFLKSFVDVMFPLGSTGVEGIFLTTERTVSSCRKSMGRYFLIKLLLQVRSGEMARKMSVLKLCLSWTLMILSRLQRRYLKVKMSPIVIRLLRRY